MYESSSNQHKPTMTTHKEFAENWSPATGANNYNAEKEEDK